MKFAASSITWYASVVKSCFPLTLGRSSLLTRAPCYRPRLRHDRAYGSPCMRVRRGECSAPCGPASDIAFASNAWLAVCTLPRPLQDTRRGHGDSGKWDQIIQRHRSSDRSDRRRSPRGDFDGDTPASPSAELVRQRTPVRLVLLR